MKMNADVTWDHFDPVEYVARNYASARAEDLLLVRRLTAHWRKRLGMERLSAIDVGSGANLYPALSLLPWSRRLTFWELSRSNAEWLNREIRSYSSLWDTFWREMAELQPHKSIDDPRAALASVAVVKHASIFDLPAEEWDVGTMWFVAESITTSRNEFERALDCFFGALRPLAPFAACFMEGSVGYCVGKERFPALSIFAEMLQEEVQARVHEFELERIPIAGEALRSGYTGMLLVLGSR
jgi:hypothetical protein